MQARQVLEPRSRIEHIVTGRSVWKGPDQKDAASEGLGREVDPLPSILVLVFADVIDFDTSQNSLAEDDLFRKPRRQC